MVNKEILEGMTAEQVMQLLQKVKERRRAAIARVNDAIRGYQKAVSARDAKIQELKEGLNEQLAGIAERVAAANAAILKAAIAEDSAESEKAQRALAELESQRSQLNARLESLSGKPPRCDEAYAAMEAAVAESDEADARCREDIAVIREFCEKVIQPWAEITSSLCINGATVDNFFLDRARTHYSRDR